MAGSDHQHDEQQPQAGPGDALRDAVERTFRDAAGALQRLAAPAAPEPDALAALTARVEELSARVEKLEAKQGKAAKGGKAKAKPRAKKQPASRS